MPSRRKHIRRKSLRRTKSRRGGKPGTRQYLQKPINQRKTDYRKAWQTLTNRRNREIDLHRALLKHILESGSSDASHDGNLSDTIHSRNADALNEQINFLRNIYFTEQEIAAAEREDALAARASVHERNSDDYALGSE